MAARHLAGDLVEEAPQDTDDEAVPNYVGRHFRGAEQAETHESEPAIEEEDSAEPAEPEPQEPELEDLAEAEPEPATEPEPVAEDESAPEREPVVEDNPEPEPEPALEPVTMGEMPGASREPDNEEAEVAARDYIDRLLRELELEMQPKEEPAAVLEEPEPEAEPDPEPEPEPELEPELEPETVEEPEEPEPEPEEEPEPEFEPVPEDEPGEKPAPKEPEPESARETYVASSASPMFVDLFDEPLDEPLDEPVVEPTIEPLDEAAGEDDSREDPLSSTQELSGVVSPTMPEPVRITDEHGVDLETLDPTLAMQRIRVRTRKDGLDDTIPINRNDVRDAIRKVMPVAGETSPRLDVQRRSHDSREGAVEGRQESVPVIRMESNEIVPKDDKGSSRTGRAIVTRERRRPFGFLATFGEFISRLLHLDDRR